MWLPAQRAHACCLVTAHQGTFLAAHQVQALRGPGQTFRWAELAHFGAVLRASSRSASSQLGDFAPTSLVVLSLLAMDLELLTQMSFLPPPQESGTVRQLSIDFFLKTLSFVEGQEKRKMQKTVCRNLVLLYLHLHDEEENVSKVGIRFIWGRVMLLPWCPPYIKSTAAHSSISPCCCILPAEGLWGHGLCGCSGCGAISALWQASQKALLGAARFLRWRKLEHLVQTEQFWQISDCMVCMRNSMPIPTPQDRVGTSLH